MDVYRLKIAEFLNEGLKVIKEELEISSTRVNVSIDQVSNNCYYMRNRVQLVTEQGIEFLNEQNERMIGQIDAYEKERKEAFEKEGQANKEAFQKVIDEVNELHLKWTKGKSEFQIDENETRKAIAECSSKLKELKESQHKFQKSVFGEKKLELNANQFPLSIDVLGILEVSVIESVFGFVQFTLFVFNVYIVI